MRDPLMNIINLPVTGVRSLSIIFHVSLTIPTLMIYCFRVAWVGQVGRLVLYSNKLVRTVSLVRNKY
jgi:hypothetical protein